MIYCIDDDASMKVPEKSPGIASVLNGEPIELSPEIVRLAKEHNERYLHWDELKYRDLGGYEREEVWRLMKLARTISYDNVRIGGLELSFSLLDKSVQEMLFRLDRRMASGLPEPYRSDPKRGRMLLVSSMMEESIASSRIEGAETDPRRAKKMLRSELPPKDRSEAMIAGNYRAMKVVLDSVDGPLTPRLILDIHRAATEGLMDGAGRFREDDSIAVRDVYEDITYHEPARHGDIPAMIEDLCRFANEPDGMHPLVKAILLHYILAHIHPFEDGNGRTSRALFYWFCMREGCPLIGFTAVSKAIGKHRQGYSMAYLLSETDHEDVTYFVRYNLRMISEAFRELDSYTERKGREEAYAMEELEDMGLSPRQSRILMDLKHSPEPVSQYELSAKHQTPVPTIRRDLMRLLDMGLIAESGKDGHRQLYAYVREK